MSDLLFSDICIGSLTLRNRIVRSATYEGAADADGVPNAAYSRMYDELAPNGIGMVITGFLFVSREGHAMQPQQAGLLSPAAIDAFRDITALMHRHHTPIIAQLAHAGRQTRKAISGSPVVSTTRKRSLYFRARPRKLKPHQMDGIVEQFMVAAAHAQEAGFDGVQLHAAHGYLLHQFLLQDINRLAHDYGIDASTGIGTLLLERIIDGIRNSCGEDYPILVKISGETDFPSAFFPERFQHLIAFLDRKQVAAIEISYGSMDYAMNIFRGNVPFHLALKHNPLFTTRSAIKRRLYTSFMTRRLLPVFKPFSTMYNLPYAAHAKTHTSIPIITVGGVRAKDEMEQALASGNTDLLGMSRPFLREPDFAASLAHSTANYSSRCRNCNHCVLMVDAGQPTRCYQRISQRPEGQIS